MEKTAADWSNEVAETDKEISEAIRQNEEVAQAILDLRRKRIELESARSKAKCNLELLKVKRSLQMHNVFNCRNSGL